MTQENNNTISFLWAHFEACGTSVPQLGSNPCPQHTDLQEVPISYSVKVILNSQVCRNNFLKSIHSLIILHPLIPKMKIILDKNENSYYLDKICNVKICKYFKGSLCIYYALSLHLTLKGTKRAQRADTPPESAV